MISVALFFSPKYKIPRLDTLVAIEGKLPILKYIFIGASGELFLKINFQWKIKIIALFHLTQSERQMPWTDISGRMKKTYSSNTILYFL